MRALVTGGCGFIGSNVVKTLLAKNVQVRVLDNLFTGYAKMSSGPSGLSRTPDIRKGLIQYTLSGLRERSRKVRGKLQSIAAFLRCAKKTLSRVDSGADSVSPVPCYQC
jgi:dTDP-D-glucose 4,6-dehydratase